MQSLSLIILIATILASATIVNSLEPELTIYSHRNASGNSITFKSKLPDAAQWKFFWYIFSERYYCWTGSWAFYSSPNYRGTIRTTGYSETPFCLTMDLNFVNSIRFMGPSDTSVESISFYNGTMNHPTSGDEMTLLPGNDSIEYMPFVPTALVTTGFSNWTLYSGPNFTGGATCFQPDAEFDSETLTGGRFYLSVRKGCQVLDGIFV